MRKTYHESVKYKEEIERIHIQKYLKSNIRVGEGGDPAKQMRILRTMVVMRKASITLLDLRRDRNKELQSYSLMIGLKADVLLKMINQMIPNSSTGSYTPDNMTTISPPPTKEKL